MSPVACPRCASEELELVEVLDGGLARVVRCAGCGHQWRRGDPAIERHVPADDPPVVFDADDAGYLDWTRRHPFGYVVNTTRPPSASYLVLHEADCYHINVEDHRMSGQPWTGNAYLKVCSRSKDSLADWAREGLGGELTRCQTCAP